MNGVAPRLVAQGGASAALPAGIIPAQMLFDARRISRAHEMYDEIVAFTFGHELAHHYLGHTGCANGQAAGFAPAIEQIGRFVTNLGQGFNQPNEIAADSAGCISVLDAGLARASSAYRWTEAGGLALLDFFDRLEKASGANPIFRLLAHPPQPWASHSRRAGGCGHLATTAPGYLGQPSVARIRMSKSLTTRMRMARLERAVARRAALSSIATINRPLL